MTALWLRLRADLRHRWRALLGLALLLGVIGGVVLAAAAGARRTDTAYPRLLEWANATRVDVIVEGSGLGGYDKALARLPQVAAIATEGLYQATPPGRYTTPVNAIASPDGALGVTVDRAKVLAGRVYDAAKPGQAMIDQRMAAMEHIAPGGTLRLAGIPNNPDGTPDFREAAPLTFRVTAIVAFDNQIVPTGSIASEPTALLSTPFAATPLAGKLGYGVEALVRLRPGASMTAFQAQASALAKRYPATGERVIFVDESGQVSATERATRPQAVALAAFAALTGLIAMAVIGQLLSRQLTLEAAEFPILAALGVTRASLCALSLAKLAVVTVTGAVIAVAVAIAESPLMPIGPARLAEPHAGVEVNLAILGLGAAVVALLPLAVLAGPAWRAAKQSPAPLGVAEPAAAHQARPSRLAMLLTRTGSVTGGIGLRMAFEPGRGRTAVPVRSALAGSAIAVAAVVAAAVFGASLVGLVSTPHEYGRNWDQRVDLGFGGVPGTLGARIAATAPGVAGYAAGNYGQLTVGGQVLPAIGVDQPRDGGYLTLLAGRAPAKPDEIALGAQTLRAIGRQVGQSIPVTIDQVITHGPDVRRIMRIVGVAVFPAFSRGSFAPTGLGTGAVVTASVLSVQSQPGATSLCVTRATCYNFFLLRYQPGTDQGAAAARVSGTLLASGCPPGSCTVGADERPGDIKNYAAIRDTPLVLAAVLVVLAVATLAHVLLTGVRRRRRDLAVLKTLGLARSQLLRVVAWEASAFAATALVIGVPLGVLAGRWAWAVFAGAAGVGSEAEVPVTLLLLAIPVTLLLANLIAAGPGWGAARVRPAGVLRAE